MSLNIRPAQLDGKVAVVTGGSGGIGAATAHKLAAEGASVIIAYHQNDAKAEVVRSALPGKKNGVVKLSIEERASVDRMREVVTTDWGRCDILINAAGFTKPIPHSALDALTDEFMDSVFATNVRGPFSVIRALAPLLKASGDGVIVNISSISGFTGSGSNLAYCAAKAALDTMTLSLGRVLGPEIRVLAVSPGAVATDFVAGRDRAALEKIAQATPLKRVVEPDDVAMAVMACITHFTASTGMRIIVDGGRFLV